MQLEDIFINNIECGKSHYLCIRFKGMGTFRVGVHRGDDIMDVAFSLRQLVEQLDFATAPEDTE